MKINLLYIIIIATAFSSLKIHTMGNPLALQQVQQYFLAATLSPNNHKKIVPPTSTTPNQPVSLPRNNNNNNNHQTASEKTFTVIAINDTDTPLTGTFTLTQPTKDTHETILLTQQEQPNPIADILIQENTIQVSCCNNNIICSKTTAAKLAFAICSCTTLLAGIIALIKLQ